MMSLECGFWQISHLYRAHYMYSNILRSFYVILSTAVFISPKPDARQISNIGQTIRVQKWEKEFNGFLTVEFGWVIGDDGDGGVRWNATNTNLSCWNMALSVRDSVWVTKY